MNKFLLFVFAIFSLSFGTKREVKHFTSPEYNASYESMNGKFDGKYTSYYPNGKKKAEGTFKSNYRIGMWTVWDESGRPIIKRKYSDPFTFERITPPLPKDKPIQLFNVPRYKIEYNPDGYISYFDLKERMVFWATRIWRNLEPNDNPEIFENNRLFKLLNSIIIEGKLTVYDTTTDEFRKEFKEDLDTTSYQILGFKIKEDTFFDIDRFVMESRIIGICPVVINSNNDTIDLYWVYYPTIRKILSKETIQTPDPRINSLDDLFFYRYFSGQIYKQSNVYDKAIADYKKGKEIKEEAEKIEISLIETEHDIWKQLTK